MTDDEVRKLRIRQLVELREQLITLQHIGASVSAIGELKRRITASELALQEGSLDGPDMSKLNRDKYRKPTSLGPPTEYRMSCGSMWCCAIPDLTTQFLGRFSDDLPPLMINCLTTSVLLDTTSGVREVYQMVKAKWGQRHRPRQLCMGCLLYTSPSPRDQRGSRMPSSA